MPTALSAIQRQFTRDFHKVSHTFYLYCKHLGHHECLTLLCSFLNDILHYQANSLVCCWETRLCLRVIRLDSPCRPPNPTTAGLQPCTQQDKGSNRDDLQPSEISVSVPAPPEGLFGSHFSWLLGSWNRESKTKIKHCIADL